MSSVWIADLYSTIFTIVSTRSKRNLIADYPKIFFTTEDRSDNSPIFPTVYFEFLESAELGTDMEGDSVNAILCTVQVDVTVSKTQGQKVARKVIYDVVDRFKELRFSLDNTPMFIDTGSSDTKRISARFSRVVCEGDTVK